MHMGNYILGGAVVAAGLMAVSCASKNPVYRDSSGRVVRAEDSYRYGGEVPDANAPLAVPAYIVTENLPWPKTLVNGTTTNVVYQPQVETWDGSSMTARNAVAVQPQGASQAIYGVIHVRAATLVDKTNNTVSLLNLQVTDAEFPSAVEKKEEFLQGIREKYPDGVQVMSLAALENAVAANQEQQKSASEPLQNTPPRIVPATRPTVLVNIDGPPVYKPVEGTDLENIVNTRMLLLRDKAGKYFLHVLDGYMSASTLEGAWTVSPPPAGATEAETHARQLGLDLLEPAGLDSTRVLTDSNPPEVVISTTPAELITFDGEPDYVPIPGTQLLYVTNTTANVFKSISDQQTYVLLSGRWYKGPGLEGPWQFVEANQLPPDFANIPDNSPKENVKASVPGTAQAKEAVIANSIPTSTGVRRGTVLTPPQLDGPARLEPISGTPLHYVANSGTPIIKVDENSWYACQDGVWYAATSLDGPWVAAESVPAVIYSIPPSSPMHYVTYVRVYDTSPEVIYQGYTPGYMGTVVNSDSMVVYGTGYWYSPWIGSYWYGRPMTWGMGWAPFWSPWTSWSYGYGFGWYYWGYYPHYYHHHYYACRPPRPYWGPYRHYAPAALSPYRPAGINTAANIYQRPAISRRTTTRFPERTGGASAFAGGYNSRTGRMVAGQRGEVDNVFRVRPGALPSGPVRISPRTTTTYSGGKRNLRTQPSVFSSTPDRPSGMDLVPRSTAGSAGRMGERMPLPARTMEPSPSAMPRGGINLPTPAMGAERVRSPSRSSAPGIEQRRRR